MNNLPNPFEANLNDFVPPASSPTPPSDKQKDDLLSQSLEEWLLTAMRNTQRMAVDEEYRKSIAQHLS